MLYRTSYSRPKRQKGLITKIIITMMGLDSDDRKPNLNASQPASSRKKTRMENPCRSHGIIHPLHRNALTHDPDISFAVSEVGRFSSSPKQSHARAVKTIVRYIAGTIDKGMILKTRGDLKLELLCDADFAGLYKRDDDRSLDSA
jgi:hypothetical protein